MQFIHKSVISLIQTLGYFFFLDNLSKKQDNKVL